MFNMQHTGKIISSARKAQNMTQLELADQLGISFQAVSNWERGISMPDIAKLPEVAQLLQISINDLLGETSPLVNGLLEEGDTYPEHNSISQEELIDVAPILKPAQFKIAFENIKPPFENSEDLSNIVPLLPYMEDKMIDELAQKIYTQHGLPALSFILPFINADLLTQIACQEFEKGGLDNCTCLAPFLNQKTIDTLVEKSISQNSVSSITSFAPFISHTLLDEIANQRYHAEGISSITSIVPFISQVAIDAIATDALLKEGLQGIASILPFISKDIIHKIVKES